MTPEMLVTRCICLAQNFRSEAHFFSIKSERLCFVTQFCQKGVSQITSIMWSVLFCIHKFCDELSDVSLAEQCHSGSGVNYVNPSKSIAILPQFLMSVKWVLKKNSSKKPNDCQGRTYKDKCSPRNL